MSDWSSKIEEHTHSEPLKIVLGGSSHIEWKKLTYILTEHGKKRFYQQEKATKTQVFHKNIEISELNISLAEMSAHFCECHIFSPDKVVHLKLTKKGKVLLNTEKSERPAIAATHNRQKNYILREGEIIPPLVDMGIFTKDGAVHSQMQHKYRQINRFVELVDDAIGDKYKSITIADFGCGKSYLTFILYYYLTEIKGINATIIGLDLKADVIKNCNIAAKKYGYTGLSFEIGDINGYTPTHKIDMLITLHACDTATDYALFGAINWGTDIILSVPCCQHELNAQIEPREHILGRYGIIKERYCALLTDIIRANLLEYCGYKTQILEFIDLSHSPKNLLIRAVKSNISAEKRERALSEVKELCSENNLSPTLLNLLTGK